MRFGVTQVLVPKARRDNAEGTTREAWDASPM